RAFLENASENPIAYAADLVAVAPLAPKANEADAAVAPTTETLLDLLFPEDRRPISEEVLASVRNLAREARVFHWPLRFAQIFARGGFDCVLGNPPWERIKLQEQEYFAQRDQEIAQATNAAARKKLIKDLKEDSERQALYTEFEEAKRKAECESQFLRLGGRYPLTGRG